MLVLELVGSRELVMLAVCWLYVGGVGHFGVGHTGHVGAVGGVDKRAAGGGHLHDATQQNWDSRLSPALTLQQTECICRTRLVTGICSRS